MSKGSENRKTALFEKHVKKMTFLSFLINFPEGQYTPQNSKTRKIGFFGGSKKGPFWRDFACQKWQKPPLKVPGKSSKGQKTSKKWKKGPFFQNVSKMTIFVIFDQISGRTAYYSKLKNPKKRGFWGGQKMVIFDTFLKFHPKIRPSATLKNRPRKEPGEGQKLEFGGRKKGVQKKMAKNVFFKNRFLRLPEKL